MPDNKIQSMTGFGRAAGEVGGRQITVEVKTLNSKQLDLTVKIPQSYREAESELRQMAAAKLLRGKAELMVSVDSSRNESKTTINGAVFAAYYQSLTEVYRSVGREIDSEAAASILRFPDVLETPRDEVSDDDLRQLRDLAAAALDACVAYRADEGESLSADLAAKSQAIAALKSQVAPLDAERKEAVRARVAKALDELGAPERFDPTRFEQEMIYYLEKLDINEEQVRLDQHLRYFAQTLEAGGEAGRKLGFIAQEMGREINTMGSKANHAGIQALVVRMKDELEKIKEQVLNVL